MTNFKRYLKVTGNPAVVEPIRRSKKDRFNRPICPKCGEVTYTLYYYKGSYKTNVGCRCDICNANFLFKGTVFRARLEDYNGAEIEYVNQRHEKNLEENKNVG
jgi:hypothetical protein